MSRFLFMGQQEDPEFDTIEARGDVRIYVCGNKCNAGGREEHDGHKFDIPWESDDGLSGGFRCQCGLDNISFSMWAGE